MIGIPGYALGERLRANALASTYRARRERDGLRVALKVPAERFPSAKALARLQHEFELTHDEELDCVIHALALERFAGSACLVLEDQGGDFLANREPGPLALSAFFRIARCLTRSLHAVHAAGIIHKDVSPASFVVSRDYQKAWLGDFGIATRLSQETAQDLAPSQLEGTLAYMAPEQTGRMNRPVDRRSDLYSLGVTFYELLTGTLPILTRDPLELVHHHVARVPKSPRMVRPSLPLALSLLVMKLLEKDAELRYQSASGLEYDLELCERAQHDLEREIELGTRDVPDEFRVPQLLYGRDADLERLDAAMLRVQHGAVELLQVVGPSGIGKSALVSEVARLGSFARANLARGKFQQFARDTPHLAVREAFRDLTRHLLAEADDRLEHYRERLAEALGPDGSVLVALVPEMELILGPQGPVLELGLSESQARFNHVVRRFVRALASAEHPLLIFLDDVQWADQATLSLLDNLLKDTELSHTLLVVAYRDDEVGPSHPFKLLLDELGEGKRTESIRPRPLDLDAVSSLLAETLDSPTEYVRPLAEIVSVKTEGNPYFVREFLRDLHRDGHIRFDARAPRWIWDLAAIREHRTTDNVVELVVERLERLPAETREVLALAAVLGNRVSLSDLARVSGRSPLSVVRALEPAVAAVVLIPLGDDYKYTALIEQGTEGVAYVFPHDRVLQVVYSGIAREERVRLHARIGELLLERSDELVADQLFAVVTHLSEALEVLTPEVRPRAAKLLLEACRKANASMAYGSARHYTEIGRRLLGERGFEEHYETAWGLAFEALKVAFLLGDYDAIEPLRTELEQRSNSRREAALAAEIQVQYLVSTMQYAAALDSGIPLLRELGVSLPRKATKLDVALGLLRALYRVRGNPMELTQLPALSNPSLRVALRLIVTMSAAAYATEPELFPLLVFALVESSVRHGNSPEAAFGYVCFGLSLTSVLGRYDRGLAFGRLAQAMVEQHDARDLEARVRFLNALFIRPWSEPLVEGLEDFRIGAKRGLETGDLEYYSYNLFGLDAHRLILGEDLSRLSASAEAHHRAIILHSQEKVSLVMLPIRETIAFLRDQPGVCQGELDEPGALALAEKRGDKTSIGYFHTFRCLRAYHAGEPQRALAEAAECRKVQEGLDGQIFVPFFEFFESLSLLSVGDGGSEGRVAKNQRRLRRVAERAPRTFLAKWHLVEGERSARKSRVQAALEHFERAIALAEAEHNQHEVGLGHQLAARCLEAAGMQSSAGFHRLGAERAFQSWGALRLVPGRERGPLSGASANFRAAQALDVESVVRVGQALSEKLRVEEIVREVLSLAVGSAGATRGALLLKDAGHGLELHALAEVERGVRLFDPPEAELDRSLPQSLLRYVARTGEVVVIGDAAADPRLSDTDMVERGVRSLLLTPMRLQGEVRGVLLVENSLARHAFTPERSRLVEVMATQAAISLQNGQLYRDLERSLEAQTALTTAHARFVPHQFLAALGRANIQDVELGDCVSRELSVLFSDVRGFTPLIESLGPAQSIHFVNDYLAHMEPPIVHNGGFVDSYIGDAIMALFEGRADDAVAAGIGMVRGLARFNEARAKRGDAPVRIGIGINTGPIMLGTIGGPNSMKCGVIGDAVNLAARIESLTKQLDATLLVGEDTVRRMLAPRAVTLRPVERVLVMGRSEPVTVYEVCDADPPALREAKTSVLQTYLLGLDAFYAQSFGEAARAFEACVAAAPGDQRARAFLERARGLLERPPPEDWDGVERMTSK